MNDPIILVDMVERSGIRTIKVVCPYCRKTHKHGAGYVKDPPNLGQRGADCGRGSYILQEKKLPASV